MGYLDDIKKKVADLEDELHGKDLQNLAIENELQEVTRAALASGSTAMVLMEMKVELYLHVNKKLSGKWSAAATASNDRLNKLIELNKMLDSISNTNFTLKGINRDLHTNYQLIRIENMELKNKLQAIVDAENF